MYIKIRRAHPHVSWLLVETQRFSYTLQPENKRLLGINLDCVDIRGGALDICVLHTHSPVQETFVFDTEAYVCNDAGKTIEVIRPRREDACKSSKEAVCPSTTSYDTRS